MATSTSSSEIRTRSVAGFSLSVAALFLALVALMIGSPALFYMGTALFAMIGACQFQAWLSVKGLRFERVAPESAHVGDLVTVEITVWSERKIRRPLVTIVDNLPKRLVLSYRSPGLPIAPAYDLPIRTQYQFRPMKRGRFRWSGLVAEGTDALGLVTKRKSYETVPTEITVLPRPIPVSLDLPNASGWGISEAESGQTRGAGLEPRGIRTYVPGDSLRHIHWRSTAKTGHLLVKEFEAGSQAAAAFILQRTVGTDVGEGATSSLEAMVGHVVFLAESFLRQGARIEFPGIEANPSHYAPHERVEQIYQVLADVQADQEVSIAEEAMKTHGTLPLGSILFVALSVQDLDLPEALAHLHSHGLQVVTLLYDANAYAKKQRRNTPVFASAVDRGFVEMLRASGAVPVMMPTEVNREGE